MDGLPPEADLPTDLGFVISRWVELLAEWDRRKRLVAQIDRVANPNEAASAELAVDDAMGAINEFKAQMVYAFTLVMMWCGEQHSESALTRMIERVAGEQVDTATENIRARVKTLENRVGQLAKIVTQLTEQSGEQAAQELARNGTRERTHCLRDGG